MAEQNVIVTHWTLHSHCEICLLLCTVKLYHGKVGKCEVSNYTLSWKGVQSLLLFPKSTTTLEFYMTYCDSKFFSFQNSFVVLTNTLNNTPKMDILIQTSIRIIKKNPAFLQVMFQYWLNHPLPHSHTQYLSFTSLWKSFQVIISHIRKKFHLFFQTSQLCS